MYDRERTRDSGIESAGESEARAPGKRMRTAGLTRREGAGGAAAEAGAAAGAGAGGGMDAELMLRWLDAAVRPDLFAPPTEAGSALPHASVIQPLFGKHDVSRVRAHVGGPAGEAARRVGAAAFAMGEDVVFAAAPSLYMAAHEAAHVVQQRAGVGDAGDRYEQHADDVAAQVVAGRSAEALLDAHDGTGGVRRAVQHMNDGGWNGGGKRNNNNNNNNNQKPPKHNDNNLFVDYGEPKNRNTLHPNMRVNTVVNMLLDNLWECDDGKSQEDGVSGYMVGVAECFDKTLVVTASGNKRPQFVFAVKKVEEKLGITLVIAEVIDSKETNLRTFHSFADHVWTEKTTKTEKDYGDCAAPKILAWTQQQDEAKAPIALVEKWFQPKLSIGSIIFGDTIPPCKDKCRRLLPKMLRGLSERVIDAEALRLKKIAAMKKIKKFRSRRTNHKTKKDKTGNKNNSNKNNSNQPNHKNSNNDLLSKKPFVENNLSEEIHVRKPIFEGLQSENIVSDDGNEDFENEILENEDLENEDLEDLENVISNNNRIEISDPNSDNHISENVSNNLIFENGEDDFVLSTNTEPENTNTVSRNTKNKPKFPSNYRTVRGNKRNHKSRKNHKRNDGKDDRDTY